MPSRKGRPNKLTKEWRERLIDYCQEQGADPFKFLVDIMQNTKQVVLGIDPDGKPIKGPAVPIQLKVKAAVELASYLAPRLKSVELKGDPDHPLTHTVLIEGLRHALERAYGAPPPPS